MKYYVFILAVLSSSCFFVANQIRLPCEQRCSEDGASVLVCNNDVFELKDCGDLTCSSISNACGECGDGIISVGEGCDDKNIENGDGCSSVCQKEGNAVCGNGLVEESEACDDGNNTNGDTCEGDCTLPVCGNGILDQGETCEDGNNQNNDGCSSSCQSEFCGDGVLQAAEECDDGNQNNNDGCSNQCDIIISAGCGNGTVESAQGEVCDDNNTLNGDGCRGDCRGIEICGDALLDAGEQCDNGLLLNSNTAADACRTNCQNARCGDGAVDSGEECDDGNQNNADSCSNNCTFLIIPEQEPNDVPVEADTVANQNAVFNVTETTRFSGAIPPSSGDSDVFRISLSSPSVVRLETFDTSGQDCQGIDTLLFLVDSGDNVISLDDTKGVRFCAAMVVFLPAGFSYIAVEDINNVTGVSGYVLEINMLANFGEEANPNNTIQDVQGIEPLLGNNFFIKGTRTAGDVDFYKIEIPADDLSIRIEVMEGDNEACESFEIDPKVSLLDAQGILLEEDDDGGRVLSFGALGGTFCSLIDGTGSSPKNPQAGNLPAGSYFIKVDASPAADADGALFDYHLAVTIR